MMSVENFEIDFIETPDDSVTFVEAKKDVIVDTKKDLNDLRDDIKTPEIQTKSDEQYYFLGQTKVESGDLRDVTDAIESHDTFSDTKITITGGADQLFMSESRGQQVLDTEIAKLRTLKSSFSGANTTMIDQLIAELTNATHHKDLANRYPRSDGRSNLGNARLIAARIASGYVEVLTTIADKIAETGNDVTVSYDIPWNQCVIGSSGNKLTDRKINVHIAMHIDETEISIDEIETPVDEIQTPVDEIETPVDEIETPVDEIPTDVVETLSLTTIQGALSDVLNPEGKLIFWYSKYTYDYNNRSQLPNGDVVVSIKDTSSGKVVLDVGYTKDGVCYVGLDGYRHIVAADAKQESLDLFVGFVATHIMAATTPKFESLLSQVAQGKLSQNSTPVIQETPAPSSVEVNQGGQEMELPSPDLKQDRPEEQPISIDTKGSGIIDNTVLGLNPDLTKVPEDRAYIDNPDLLLVRGSKEWLSLKLDKKIEGISVEKFYDFLQGNSLSISYNNPYNKEPYTINTTVSGVNNSVLRDKILSYIDRGDVRGMYENIYGMHDNNAINPYLHYRPIDKITPMMMHAMALRLWHAHEEVNNREHMDRLKIPSDVRAVWKDYKKLGLHLLSPSNGPNNFAIVSKTDFKIYLFLSDGTLVGSQPILVGKNKSDSEWLVSNTPSGKYKTNGFFNKPTFNAKYYDKGLGNFIKLWSLEDKFKNKQRIDAGIGIHELYNPAVRASSLVDDVTSNPSVRDRKRVSDGCINASNSPLDFGSLFTHLVPKSDAATCVYVTATPDQNTVYDYYAMLQQQAPVAMK